MYLPSGGLKFLFSVFVLFAFSLFSQERAIRSFPFEKKTAIEEGQALFTEIPDVSSGLTFNLGTKGIEGRKLESNPFFVTRKQAIGVCAGDFDNDGLDDIFFAHSYGGHQLFRNLGGLKFKDVTILENNSVQTMASAGESLAAGVIFTVPALLVITDPNPANCELAECGLWAKIDWGQTFVIALIGGLLGTMFTIALRRLFIVEEALPYPEGVACKEVLVAGEKGGSGLVAIIYALLIGAIYGWMVKGFKVTHAHVEGAVDFMGTRLYAGGELSLALLSVGFIVGLRIASFIFIGGVIGFGIIVPIYGMIMGWPGTGNLVDDFYEVWSMQIRYVGVGAMVVGGIYTLWSMRKTIFEGLSKSFNSSKTGTELSRTEKDLPLDKVILSENYSPYPS